MLLQELGGLQQRLAGVNDDHVAFHDIAYLEIKIAQDLGRLDMKPLEDKVHLWSQFATACRSDMLPTLQLQQPRIGVG